MTEPYLSALVGVFVGVTLTRLFILVAGHPDAGKLEDRLAGLKAELEEHNRAIAAITNGPTSLLIKKGPGLARRIGELENRIFRLKEKAAAQGSGGREDHETYYP